MQIAELKKMAGEEVAVDHNLTAERNYAARASRTHTSTLRKAEVVGVERADVFTGAWKQRKESKVVVRVRMEDGEERLFGGGAVWGRWADVEALRDKAAAKHRRQREMIEEIEAELRRLGLPVGSRYGMDAARVSLSQLRELQRIPKGSS